VGYIQLLLDEDVGQLNERQKEYLTIVDKNVRRLNTLMGEILDYQVLESGKIPLSKKLIHLDSILKECCETFRVSALSKGLELDLQIADDLRPIDGDRARLIQVFVNLISNALKYTSKGSIRVEARNCRSGVEVVVEDTGRGMKPSELKNLFRLHYRSGRDPEVAGSGLGLAITQRLVLSHGGKISVQSKVGRGTRVLVFFLGG
jgi:signal transduction histidine kinase